MRLAISRPDDQIAPKSRSDKTTTQIAPSVQTSRQAIANMPALLNQPDFSTKSTQCQDSDDLPILVIIASTGFESYYTFHNVDAICRWDRTTLEHTFRRVKNGFIVLTSCNSLPKSQTEGALEEIRFAIKEAARAAGKECDIAVQNNNVIPDNAIERLGLTDRQDYSDKDLRSKYSTSALGGLLIKETHTLDAPKNTSSPEDNDVVLSSITIEEDDLLQADPESFDDIILEAAERAGEHILAGQDILLMIHRKPATRANNLDVDPRTSVTTKGVVRFLQLLNTNPRYIAVKGGLLAFEAATKGLRMRKVALVGQNGAGTPLWICDDKASKFPGTLYAVMSDSVSSNDTLRNFAVGWARLAPGTTTPRPMQYRRLGRSALKVSRVILGCMTFGNPQWQGSPWVMPEAEALPLLKKAYDIGINTWDTADTYSNGESERIVGKALSKYAIPREKVVIMTKLYYPVMNDAPNSRPDPAINDGALVNQMGLSRKHIFAAVNASLERLGTDYIDVLQLHRLDKEASAEEIMGALHDVVRQGKVHYLGGSSMYTYQFAHLQYTARLNNWTTFTSMQNLYNLIYREEERDMNPFCDQQGIGLIPWSPIARGLLARPSQSQSQRSMQDKKTKKWFKGQANDMIIGRVEILAKEKNTTMSSIALAWLLAKNCCPIVGLNSIERIESVTEALYVDLSKDDLTFLEEEYEPQRVVAI